MLTADADWLWHRLEVTGPDQALQEFVMNAQGPGFVDWTWPPSEEREYWAAIALRGGAPSPAAAAKLAKRYADYMWWTIADARTAADCGYSIQALDLNALQPIPRKILRVGWRDGGKDWCWQHWGTCLPLRKTSFRFEHRPQRTKDGIEVVAVYEFASADWSPWRAIANWQRNSNALRFRLKPFYDIPVDLRRDSKVSHAA